MQSHDGQATHAPGPPTLPRVVSNFQPHFQPYGGVTGSEYNYYAHHIITAIATIIIIHTYFPIQACYILLILDLVPLINIRTHT